MRPGIASAMMELPKDHWIIPNLRRILKANSISDELIRNLCTLKIGSGTHILCQQVIENRGIPPRVLAQTLEHIMKIGGGIEL